MQPLITLDIDIRMNLSFLAQAGERPWRWLRDGWLERGVGGSVPAAGKGEAPEAGPVSLCLCGQAGSCCSGEERVCVSLFGGKRGAAGFL